MNKKLISLNLAIILLITLFANGVFSVSAEEGMECHELNGFEHTVILDGNGGQTSEGKPQYEIHLTITSPTCLNLNVYTGSYMSNGINYSPGVFHNNNKLLLGWKDKDGNFLNLNNIEILPCEGSTMLYAYWEDEENKAVILENCYNSTLVSEKIIEPCKKNEKYILPDMTRDGYIFEGWTSAGKLYKAGEEIVVEKTLVFTAQYRKPYDNPDFQKLIIDGIEIDAGSSRGSYSAGWHYYPGDGQYYAQLDIWENYSGEPIVVPGNVSINLNGNVTGDELNPAITVYGNADISAAGYQGVNKVQIIGCREQPAIMATGQLYMSGVWGDLDELLIKSGNSNVPAIVAPKISFYDDFFYSGTDFDKLNVAHSYIDEHILKLVPEGKNYSVTVSKGDVAPTTPQHNNYIFIGWKVIEGQGFVHPNKVLNWYMPGDVVDIESDNIILQASYLNDNRTSVAIALHGNGGVTEEDSKYYITLASTHRLSLYDIPQKSFARDGYKFNGYNSMPLGDGTNYTYDDHLNDDGSSFVYNLYAQWERIEPYVESKVKVKGGSYEVISSVKNIDGDAVVIVAGYKEKRLVDVKFNSQGLPNVLEGDIDEIKVMVWDSMISLKPLCGAELISKNEFVVEG